jgi:hypothetical protein
MSETINLDQLAKFLPRDGSMNPDTIMRTVVVAMLSGIYESMAKLTQQLSDATELLHRERDFDVSLERYSAGEIIRVRATAKSGLHKEE